MKEIALVNGKRYLDTKGDKPKMYINGKTYKLSDNEARRLLKEKTFKGIRYFGLVNKDLGEVLPDDRVLEVSPDEAVGKAPERSNPAIESDIRDDVEVV